MVENRVLRRISGLEIGDITGGRRKLHYWKLHNFYLNIIRPKSRRMSWVGRAACIEER
jgi:hypothetical protein